MKTLIIFVLTLPLFAYAADDLTMHLGCEEGKPGCERMLDAKANAHWLRSVPDITVGEAQGIQEIFVEMSEYGDPILRVQLDQAQSAKLEEITTGNVGKDLGIVMNGKVLTAPNIREGIKGGNFQISVGAGREKFWENVPWMAKRLNIHNDEEKRTTTFNVAFYILAAVTAVGGALYYGFRRV